MRRRHEHATDPGPGQEVDPDALRIDGDVDDLEAAGLQIVDIPVDAEGIRVDLLARARVGGVLVTPAHQYPTGVVLSADRRKALLAWADRRDALIIEDDYHAEFRYDRAPI